MAKSKAQILKEWRARNPEKVKAYIKKWRLKNKDVVKEYKAKYEAKLKEKIEADLARDYKNILTD